MGGLTFGFACLFSQLNAGLLSNDSQTITFKTTSADLSSADVAMPQFISQTPPAESTTSAASSTTSVTTGSHLDALAEAAASATSVLSDLMTSTASTASSLSATSTVSSSPSGAAIPVAAVSPQQRQQPVTTTVKYFDANSRQFTLSSPLLQSPVGVPPANILANSNGNVAAPTVAPTIVTTIQGTTTTQAKVTTVAKVGRGKAKEEKEDVSRKRVTQQSPPKLIENLPSPQIKLVKIKDEDKWSTVGIFKGLSHTVSNFLDFDEWNCLYDGESLSADNLPDITKFKRLNLEPGCAYRFRVAAINSCGRGEWSDVAPFKTCLPGFPGAPSAIKISKSPEGAHLSWEPPPSTTGDILEYSVYLAVKSQNAKDKSSASAAAQLAFVRVYCGPNNQCTVPNQSLQTAHVDYTSKPAIIFRIAARNDKGYGPATQVRWLQGG